MSSLFFIEFISKENFKYMNNHLTTKEYLKYIFDNNINIYPSIIKENIDDNEKNFDPKFFLETETKIKNLERIKLFINIIILEID